MFPASDLLERLTASLACHSMAKCGLAVDSCNNRNSSFIVAVFCSLSTSNQRNLRCRLSPCPVKVAHSCDSNPGVVRQHGSNTFCLKLSKFSIPQRTKAIKNRGTNPYNSARLGEVAKALQVNLHFVTSSQGELKMETGNLYSTVVPDLLRTWQHLSHLSSQRVCEDSFPPSTNQTFA